MDTVDDSALETCDQEPIHIPGAIQHFGCLIAFDRASLEIAAISDNASAFVGKKPEDVLGENLKHLFDREFLHAMANRASRRLPVVSRNLPHLTR